MPRRENGTAALEYAVLALLLGAILIPALILVSSPLSAEFSHLADTFGGGLTGDPTPSEPAEASATATVEDTPTPTPTPTVEETPTPTPTPTPSVTLPDVTGNNSDGWMQWNTRVIDQEKSNVCLNCLSIRMNLSWFPNNWNGPTYPQMMAIDVTWDPALSVWKVIPGDDGSWQYALIEPGHMRLVRTGTFDSSGLQPEPEVILNKPSMNQTVTAHFTATAPHTPTVTATSSTWSVWYN